MTIALTNSWWRCRFETLDSLNRRSAVPRVVVLLGHQPFAEHLGAHRRILSVCGMEEIECVRHSVF